MKIISCLALGLIPIAYSSPSAQAITIHTSDFIADGTRSHFNGFEAIPNDGTYYTGEDGPYSEGGISVLQVNGDGPSSIWVTYHPAGTSGNYSWYPSGGDEGYSKLTLTDGSDFQDVGFNTDTGDGPSLTIYSLWNNGVQILSGATPFVPGGYLGFSGGGFDEIHVQDNYANGNSLVIDNIETQGSASVPDGGTTFAMLGMALGSMAAMRYKMCLV